jgi:hypothetical protein
VFSVLSLAIKARSTSSTRVRGVGRLERRGGKGGWVSNCSRHVINPVLP